VGEEKASGSRTTLLKKKETYSFGKKKVGRRTGANSRKKRLVPINAGRRKNLLHS